MVQIASSAHGTNSIAFRGPMFNQFVNHNKR
jgi:hypothetical protein